MELTVLFDGRCSFCIRCAHWLATEPQYTPLRMIDRNAPQVRVMYPDLRLGADELVVIDSNGGIYREGHAFIMCLWALSNYRSIAQRISAPALMPLSRSFFRALSTNRAGFLKSFLGDTKTSDLAVQRALDAQLANLNRQQLLPSDRCER